MGISVWWGLEPGEVRGVRGGGSGNGRAVELLLRMRGWHTAYADLKAVEGLMTWGRQILEAGVALSLACVHSEQPKIVAFRRVYRVCRG